MPRLTSLMTAAALASIGACTTSQEASETGAKAALTQAFNQAGVIGSYCHANAAVMAEATALAFAYKIEVKHGHYRVLHSLEHLPWTPVNEVTHVANLVLALPGADTDAVLLAALAQDPMVSYQRTLADRLDTASCQTPFLTEGMALPGIPPAQGANIALLARETRPGNAVRRAIPRASRPAIQLRNGQDSRNVRLAA